jgi:hypothetical protein
VKNADSKFLEFHEAFRICYHENIIITREIVDKSQFIIQINYNGRIKKGIERYNPTKDRKKVNAKIAELYEKIARQILSRSQNV